MAEFEEAIDIRKYHWDYIRTLSEDERLAINQTHVERAKQGSVVWNSWAEKVLTEIEKNYPERADEKAKLAIRNQYIIDFSGIEIEKRIDFSFFSFPSRVHFALTKFSGHVSFDTSVFYGDIFFYGTIFLGDLHFNEVEFRGAVIFLYVNFFQSSRFIKVSFSEKSITFLGSQFHQNSLFVDMRFVDSAKVMPCDFRQTYFHLPPLVTDFPSDVSTFIQANKDKQRGENFYKDCEAKFRELKKLAEGNNNHQKSLEFYGCELYCQRRASGGLRNLKNWASWLYGLLSGYGLSLLRPTLLWLGVMLGSMGLQAVLDDKLSFSPTATINTERVGFYLSPSLPPFINKPLYQKEVRKRLYSNPQNKQLSGQLPAWNRCIRTFQALMTFIAMFLFGLALRNRFKIS